MDLIAWRNRQSRTRPPAPKGFHSSVAISLAPVASRSCRMKALESATKSAWNCAGDTAKRRPSTIGKSSGATMASMLAWSSGQAASARICAAASSTPGSALALMAPASADSGVAA
eukprot:CAMPEP_0206018130 /NCGR_PEP_ID=MMETSP1464-20131121/26459_1 /ASSEMBLY_ACC=CAM_ASM_001124 /TAXON_ID=119497 /ORGANISM="Exanthemachrysis gayraliae, Strain RCC1523" /LENGTH=114 /DNA_ID=CAMNT_0053391993 /DNA_START=54 /DNA_END=395 /DNA_ORIENTATION=+